VTPSLAIMYSDNAANLQAALNQAHAALTAAVANIASMPEGQERARQARTIATLLVGSPEALRVQAILQCPDIESAEPIPDTQLNTEELAMVSHLTLSDLALIDRTLLSNARPSWQMVSRVVGYTLVDLKHALPGIPLGLYALRAASLVRSGTLLGRGNLGFIRLSEVCLPGEGDSRD
jgi:hypothetical protein